MLLGHLPTGPRPLPALDRPRPTSNLPGFSSRAGLAPTPRPSAPSPLSISLERSLLSRLEGVHWCPQDRVRGSEVEGPHAALGVRGPSAGEVTRRQTRHHAYELRGGLSLSLGSGLVTLGAGLTVGAFLRDPACGPSCQATIQEPVVWGASERALRSGNECRGAGDIGVSDARQGHMVC